MPDVYDDSGKLISSGQASVVDDNGNLISASPTIPSSGPNINLSISNKPFAERHPILNRLYESIGTGEKDIYGNSQFAPGSKVLGPGTMQIPGVEKATDYLQHQIDPTESPFYTGIRPAIAGGVKVLGGILGGGFDPRGAGVRGSGITNPVAADILSGKVGPTQDIPSSILAKKPRIRLGVPDESGNTPPPRVLDPGTSDPVGDTSIKPNVTPIDTIGEAPLHFQPKGPAPDSFGTPQPQTAPQKLLDAIKSIVPKTQEQRNILATERYEKLQNAVGLSGEGKTWADDYMSAFKGKHSKLISEPLKLEPADVDELFSTIKNSPDRIGFEKLNAITGLRKILSGEVPQMNELQSVGQVFGKEFVSAINPHLSKLDRARPLISELSGLPKSIMSSIDMSMPFRQGLPMANRKEFWKAWVPMFKSGWSDEAFQASQKVIESNPLFNFAEKSGVKFGDLINHNEEAFIGKNFAERIPGLGRGIVASNRAAVTFINKVRMDVFSSLIENAERAGLSPKSNPILSKQIGEYINTATGKGNLGKYSRIADDLNVALYSPQMIKSRVDMLNPNNYIRIGKEFPVGSPEAAFMRRQYLKSALSIASSAAITGSLGKMAGADVSMDPTSADFLKVKLGGKVRLDPMGGYQQYMVALAQFMMGEKTNTNTGNSYELGSRYGLPDKIDNAVRFGESKLSPVFGLADKIARRKDRSGMPYRIPKETIDMFIPMFVGDMYQLYQEEPGFMPFLAPLGGTGMGVMTYGQESLGGEADKFLRNITNTSMPSR